MATYKSWTLGAKGRNNSEPRTQEVFEEEMAFGGDHKRSLAGGEWGGRGRGIRKKDEAW